MNATRPRAAPPALRAARLQLMVPAEPEASRTCRSSPASPRRRATRSSRRSRKYIHVVELRAGRPIVLREGEYSDSAYYIVERRGRGRCVAERRGRGATPRGARRRARASRAQRPGARPEQRGHARPRPGTVGHRHPLRASRRDRPGPAHASSSRASSSARSAPSRATRSRPPCARRRRCSCCRSACRGLRCSCRPPRSSRSSSTPATASARCASHLRSVELFAERRRRLHRRGSRTRPSCVSFEPGQVIVAGGHARRRLLPRARRLREGGRARGRLRPRRHLPAQGRLRGRGGAAPRRDLALHPAGPRARGAGQAQPGGLPGARWSSTRPIEDELWAGIDGAAQGARGGGAQSRPPPSTCRWRWTPGLIHGESVLLIDLTTCTRCDECVRGCADAHGGEPALHPRGRALPQLADPHRLLPVHRPRLHDGLPDRRHHPRGRAPSRSRSTTSPTCIGCGNCASRCPWGNITMVRPTEKRAGRQAGGAGHQVRPLPDAGPRARPACRCARTARPCASPSRTSNAVTRDPEVRRCGVSSPGPAAQGARATSLIAAAVGALSSSLVYAVASWRGPGAPSAGSASPSASWPRSLFVFEMALPVRGGRGRGPLGTAKAWMQAHVYLGVLALLARARPRGLRLPARLDGLGAAPALRCGRRVSGLARRLPAEVDPRRAGRGPAGGGALRAHPRRWSSGCWTRPTR